MKIQEALERVNNGKAEQVKKIDLARILWPESKIETQRVNISNLIAGKTRSIQIDMVPKLCRALDCDANYLFDIKKK